MKENRKSVMTCDERIRDPKRKRIARDKGMNASHTLRDCLA